MSWTGQAFLMEISEGYMHVASAEDLRWIPGRQSFHYEPDFCGRMLSVPGETKLTMLC